MHIYGLKLSLTEENLVIKPYNENLWTMLPDSEIVPPNISIVLLHTLHRRWVVILQEMKSSDWERTYHHPEQKTRCSFLGNDGIMCMIWLPLHGANKAIV